VLNGAKIGANCLVGAGALVTEGKEFPDKFADRRFAARAIKTSEGKARSRCRSRRVVCEALNQYAKD